MTTHRIRPGAGEIGPSPAPAVLSAWLSDFRDCFTAPVWKHVLVLVAGTVLAPGKRTVSQALRVMGLAAKPGFARYHEVLNRASWNGRSVARRLLVQVLDAFLPAGEVVIGIDDTIERRWGPKINARGIYRDPVRSSQGHFVKASGLRWLSLMVMVPIPWAGRRWALPFLTILAPSERWSSEQGRRHKKLTDWARQAIRQAKRWMPDRRLIIVADASFAALDLIAALRHQVCLVTRLRIDASLFAPAPPRQQGQMGRPRLKGRRLPKFAAVLANPKTVWSPVTVTEWYGGRQRQTGDRLRHRGLVSLRTTASTHPLGAGTRSLWRTRATSVSLHRSHSNSAANSQLVRFTLAHGDHVSGSAHPPRRRDAAAVVRFGDLAHHAGAAWLVLTDNHLGTWINDHCHRCSMCSSGCLV